MLLQPITDHAKIVHYSFNEKASKDYGHCTVKYYGGYSPGSWRIDSGSWFVH
ncbi:hypothetical protein [Peribacillus butanolivorans]|uniref:hypothetical protein n=1 Tax=Peribacillus butanolivorans TaxID=421767 RepID=UPI0035D833D7